LVVAVALGLVGLIVGRRRRTGIAGRPVLRPLTLTVGVPAAVAANAPLVLDHWAENVTDPAWITGCRHLRHQTDDV
jgi:hypothetical protein